MRSQPNLRRTQEWVQGVITHPGTFEEATAKADRYVIPSKTLTPAERVGIYRGMYAARLGEALAADYPYVQQYLGEDRFQELAEQYIEKYPSRSYTLNRLGDDFPKFLHETNLRRRAMLHDLARVELAMTEAFDAEETPVFGPEDVAKVPPNKWETARLLTIPALRLLPVNYPIGKLISAFRDEKPVPPIPRKQGWIAIFRRDYALMHLDLTKPAYGLLQSLKEGMPLGASVEKACLDRRAPVKQKQLFRWFQEWVSQGLFRGVA
jgi:hypothetical protein